MEKDWNKFVVSFDGNTKKALEEAFGDRIPEGWIPDMKCAVVASQKDRLPNREYIRLYRQIGDTLSLEVKAFGEAEGCAAVLCTLTDANGKKTDVRAAVAHDSASAPWKVTEITEWEPLEKPFSVQGEMRLERPYGITEDEVRAKYVRRTCEWAEALACPVIPHYDKTLLIDGKIKDALDAMPSVQGWREKDTEEVHVYVPNSIVHPDVSVAMRTLDSKILAQTVGRRGLEVLLNGRDEEFRQKIWDAFPGIHGNLSDDADISDRVTDFVHATARALGIEMSRTEGFAASDSPAMKNWTEIRRILLSVNPKLPSGITAEEAMTPLDRTVAEAAASYCSKVRYYDPELARADKEQITAEYNRGIARLVERHDSLALQGRELPAEELARHYSLGHPSNILFLSNANIKDCDIVLSGKAVYGKDGEQDKQYRHPYDVSEYLTDLPAYLEEPLAVFYSKPEKGGTGTNSALVMTDRQMDDPDGSLTFVVPMVHDDEAGREQMTIKSFYPKWDMDIVFLLAATQRDGSGRPLVSYVCPDFEERWLRPACERVRDYYKNTLPAIYGDGAKDKTYDAEMKKYEDFKRVLPKVERRISDMRRFTPPSDDVRFFRVQTASPEPSGDIIGSLDIPVSLAVSDGHREALLSYKRSLVEDYVKGFATTDVSVCTADSLIGQMQADGCTMGEIASVSEALEQGVEINGFAHGDRVFILSDNMHSLEQVRNTYVHERQHILDATVEKRRMDALAEEIGAGEAWRLLSCLTRDRDAYDGRSARELLGEACAYAMELAYSCEPGQVMDMLRSKGIGDGAFSAFIKEKNDEQYKDDNLCKARFSSSFCDGYRSRSRRIQKETHRARLEGQGTGPHHGHPQGLPLTDAISLAGLALAQKRDVAYPTAGELEDTASSRIVLSPVTSPFSLRINRKTRPVITKWFNLWYQKAEGNGFRPVGDEYLPEAEPDITEEAEGADVERLNERARKEAWKKTRDAYREQFLAYIDTLEGNALQLAAAKWFCTGSVRLPEDIDKVERALKVAQINKVDPHTFDSPMKLILRYANEKKVEYVSPYGFPETDIWEERVLPNGLHFFGVRDDGTGQATVRRVLNGQSNTVFQTGSCSPWCLLTATEGERVPTVSAKKHWQHYNGFPKGIWMKEMLNESGQPVLDNDGKPVLEAVAFHADDPQNKDKSTNWSIEDRPYRDGRIPLIRKDDEGHRTEDVFSEKDGRLLTTERLFLPGDASLKALAKEHFGDSADRYMKTSDTVLVKTAYDGNGRIRAVQLGSKEAIAVSYRFVGDKRTVWTRQTLLNGYKYGPYQSFWPNGNEKLSCTYTGSGDPEKMYSGDYLDRFENGQVHKKGTFTKNGLPVGEHVEYYPDGTLRNRFVYDDNSRVTHAATYRSDGSLISETEGNAIRTYYEPDGKGKQQVAAVCEDYKFIKVNRKIKAVIGRELKTEYHPNGAVRRMIHYDDYRQYLRETMDAVPLKKGEDVSSHVTVREWNDNRGYDRFLVTDDGTRQVIAQVHSLSASDSASMRIIYDGDGIREVTERLHDKGMKKHGVHCLFNSDGSAVMSTFRGGDEVEGSEKECGGKEALKTLEKNPLFRLCGVIRTMKPEDVSLLYQRLISGRNDGQTEGDNLIQEIQETHIPALTKESYGDDLRNLPFRIEGYGAFTGKESATFDDIRRWFVGLDHERQMEICGELGLEMPYLYRLDSFAEVFCHAFTESPLVTVGADKLALVYRLYDADMKASPEKVDDYLSEEKEREVSVRMREKAEENDEKNLAGEVREKLSREKELPLADIKVLGRQALLAEKNHEVHGGRQGAYPLMFCRADGSLLAGENLLAASGVAVRHPEWLPDFFTLEEIRAMGSDVVKPDAETVTVKSRPDGEGRTALETLYNIADSTLPQQYPEEYRILEFIRRDNARELTEYVSNALDDGEELKETFLENVVRSYPDSRLFKGYLLNSVDMAISALKGTPAPLPCSVSARPDELAAYRMLQCIGEAANEKLKDIRPDNDPPSAKQLLVFIRDKKKEAAEKKARNLAVTQDGTGQGKGIH